MNEVFQSVAMGSIDLQELRNNIVKFNNTDIEALKESLEERRTSQASNFNLLDLNMKQTP